MKKILYILLITLPAWCLGQTSQVPLILSRQQAIELGLQNRFDVKANKINASIAQSGIKQAQNNWFPELSANANIQYNTQLQNSIMPGGVIAGFNEDVLMALSSKTQSVFGLHLSQPIFDAAIHNDIRLAKNELALQQEKIHSQEIDVKLLISQAYLNVQLRTLQQKVAENIATRNKEYADIAQGKLKNGSIIENQYLRAKLDLENANIQFSQAQQEYDLSLIQLRHQLNVPEGKPIELTDALDMKNPSIASYLTQNGERTELRQLKIQQQGNELGLKKYQQSLLPTFAFDANYSQQYLSNNFDFAARQWWSPFSYVALRINIPISAIYKSKAHTAEYRQRMVQTGLLLEQKKTDINFEILQAQTALNNAEKNLKTTSDTYQFSKRIFATQQQQYRLGVFEYGDLLDTEKSLSGAERNYIQSAYDLVLSQINLQKATNNF